MSSSAANLLVALVYALYLDCAKFRIAAAEAIAATTAATGDSAAKKEFRL